MKVSELLIKTSQKVLQHSLQLPAPRQRLPRSDLTNRLIAIEEHLAWLNLGKLFKNTEVEVNQETIQPFIDFLANRWVGLQDIYQLAYPKTYNTTLTMVCVSLARELAAREYKGVSHHYLEFLMPTINIKNENLLMDLIESDAMTEYDSINEMTQLARTATGVSQLPPKFLEVARLKGVDASEKGKIQLHHFILDHNGYVINILDCISNAVVDGILKHPSALETVIDDRGQVPGYELCLMSKRMASKKTKNLARGYVYIKLGSDSFQYRVYGMTDLGIITAKELNLTTPALTVELLVSLQPEILEITSQRGHTQIQKQPRELLAETELQIIHHSKEGKEYYRTLLELVMEKDQAYNAADALKILTRYLFDGGMRGGKGGTEKTSGLSSYIGIRIFYDFTKTITDAELNILLAASVVYQHKPITFYKVWCELLATSIDSRECNFSFEEKQDISKLIKPHFDFVEAEAERIEQLKAGLSKRQIMRKRLWVVRPILCSEEFARQSRDIVNNPENAKLIKLIPKQYVGIQVNREQILQGLQNANRRALAAFKKAIQDNKLTHYSDEEIAQFPDETRNALGYPITERFTQSLVTSMDSFISLLVSLPREHHSHVVSELLTGKFLQESILNTPEKIIALFKAVVLNTNLKLTDTSRVILSALSPVFLRGITANPPLVYFLKLFLPSEVYQEFLLPKPGSPQRINLGFLTAPKITAATSSDNEEKIQTSARLRVS